MNWPCSIAINCPPCDQNPVRNVSVVDPDPLTCFSQAFAATPPILGNTEARHCTRWCYWTVDPGNPDECIPDAWVCAQREADICIGETFLNSQQKCSKTCPNGTIVSYTVLDGLFAGLNQDEADANAMGYACAKVDEMMTWACDITQVNLSDYTCCTVPCEDGTSQTACLPAGAFQAATKAEANALAYAAACAQAQSQCQPPVPPRPCNGQQECTVSCPDGTYYTYVVPANTYCADTQEDADAIAYNFACAMAQQGCHQDLVPNTAQTCTITCPDLSTVTLTIPSGYFFAVDEQSANLLAYNYACHKAYSYCPGSHYKRNTAQLCCVPCADGTSFCQTAPANMFFAVTQAEADRLAYNAACQRARYYQICIGNITNDRCCVNEGPCVGSFEATGIELDAVPLWYVASGSVPPGMSLQQDPTFGNIARVEGTPTLTGTYSFIILFVNTSDGRYITKSFTMYVEGIDNASPLTPATQGTPYTLQLTNNVGSGHYTWALESGTLPSGLNLNTTTGKITGTPNTAGTSTFSVSVTDTGHASLKCTKSLELTVIATGFIAVPLRLYHGLDDISQGVWHYGVNYYIPPAPPPTMLYQSRAWIFRGILGSQDGPYSDTGLFVALPDGADVVLTLDINPVTEPSPLTTHSFHIDSTVRLFAWDTLHEGVPPPYPSGLVVLRGIELDNAHFAAASLPNFFLNIAYSAPVGDWLNGAAAPTYTLASGTLPNGLVLDGATGTISGTPVAPALCQQYDFVITVSDGTYTESCPFTLFCGNQFYGVIGQITIPDHFERWIDGVDVKLSPVGNRNVVFAGDYQDDLQGGYMLGLVDTILINNATDGLSAASTGYSFVHLASGGGGWSFDGVKNVGVRIPIIDGVAGACSFLASTQFEDYFSMTPIGIGSDHIDFVVYSDDVPTGPVGSYTMRIRSIEELINSIPVTTSHTCNDPSIGTLTVT